MTVIAIDIGTLVAVGVGPTQARVFAPFIVQAMKRFDIWMPAAQAAFIAQTMHESSRFTHLEENLHYRTAEQIQKTWPKRFPKLSDAAPLINNPRGLANTVYCNRLGNGDVSTDDGWRYRGRGLIQITGCTNYRVSGDALGQDFAGHPELVAAPEHASMTAGWLWSSAGCNAIMAGGDFDASTKRINGGMVGAAERRELYEVCRQVIK